MRGAGAKKPAPKAVSYEVEVTGVNLNVRKEPSNLSESVGKVSRPARFGIVMESEGAGASLWGQIKPGSPHNFGGRWIALDYTRKVSGAAAAPNPAPKTYKVQLGDTLSQIAARFGTTTDELARLNNIVDIHRIKAGQVLKLP